MRLQRPTSACGILASLFLLCFLCMGCMAPVRAVSGAAQSLVSTTATGLKAGGIMLKDASKATMDVAGSAWRKAAANSPDIDPPSQEP